MAAMGFNARAVDRMRARADDHAPDAGMAIHPDNVTALRWLLAVQTQWRSAVLSTMSSARLIRTGLDYAALEPAARLAGLEPGPDDFVRLRALEVEVLSVWAEEQTR